MNDLRATVREAVNSIADLGPGSIEPHIAKVREALTTRGLGKGCHVGTKGMVDGSDQCMEWYAGQLLSIYDSESWFAMNSLINCLDRFCPEESI